MLTVFNFKLSEFQAIGRREEENRLFKIDVFYHYTSLKNDAVVPFQK